MTELTMRQIRQLEHDLRAHRSGVAAEAHDELTRATRDRRPRYSRVRAPARSCGLSST
jgi:hypothetical protein